MGISLSSEFYCTCCGRKGIPIPRKKGSEREAGHLKKLYCIYCKEEVNHIECRTPEEVEEFKENFENGVYKDEAKESLDYVRSSRIGQKHVP